MAAPYLIGQNSALSSSQVVISVATSTTAGDSIIVSMCGSDAPTSVTDSQGNIYTKDNSSANLDTAVFVSPGLTGGSSGGGTAALSSSTPDTITCTYGSSGSDQSAIAAGLTGYSTVDVKPTPATGTSATPSQASGGLSVPNETIFTAFVTTAAGGTPSGLTNCTSLGTQHSSPGRYVTLAYYQVSSTASVTSSCTVAIAGWTVAIVSLELSPAAAGDSFDASTLLAPGAFTSPGPNAGVSLDLTFPDSYDNAQPPALASPGTQDASAFDFSSLVPPDLFDSPGNLGIWLPDFISGSPQPLPLIQTDPTAYDASVFLAPGLFIAPSSLGFDWQAPFYDGGQPAPIPPGIPSDPSTTRDFSENIPPGPFGSPAASAPAGFWQPDFTTGAAPFMLPGTEDPTTIDYSQLVPPGLFGSPGSLGIWAADFYSAGQPPGLYPQPDLTDQSAQDYSSLPSPGPFLSPGPNQASMDIWQPDFDPGGEQPPALAGPGNQDPAASDYSSLTPPGPFGSPGALQANLGLYQPDFYSGGQPAGIPVSVSSDPAAFDASSLLSPGPFISPGPNQASMDIWQPDFYVTGGALPPPGSQDPRTLDFSQNVPPGPFISPGFLFLPPPPFYDGGQPAPVPQPPVQNVFDFSQLIPPGLFISPGNPGFDPGAARPVTSGAAATSAGSLLLATPW